MASAVVFAYHNVGVRCLSALLAGGVDRPGLDLAAVGRMFTRITERHAARMSELGLAS